MNSTQQKEQDYRSIDRSYIGIPWAGCHSCSKQLHIDIKLRQHDDKIKYKHNLSMTFKIFQTNDTAVLT